MKIGAIIQARTGSTRLSRKVLLPLPINGDIVVLQHVIRRVSRSESLDEVIVATTNKKKDDVIEKIALKEKVICFRGSEKNVLRRYYFAAKRYKLDTIVRITADCPCIDSEIIEMVIGEHIKNKADYTSNTLERTYPRGFDVEVMSFRVLENAYRNATHDFEKEHVTPYIYKTVPRQFKIFQVKHKYINCSDLRLTLDTKEDYKAISIIFKKLYPKNAFFRLSDIMNLYTKNIKIKLINQYIVQKPI